MQVKSLKYMIFIENLVFNQVFTFKSLKISIFRKNSSEICKRMAI